MLIEALESQFGNGSRLSDNLRREIVKGYVEYGALWLHKCMLATTRKLSLVFVNVLRSNTEVDFVASGLEETMLVSWDNVKRTALGRVSRTSPSVGLGIYVAIRKRCVTLLLLWLQGCNFRTAAYLIAIDRIATCYRVSGIFP